MTSRIMILANSDTNKLQLSQFITQGEIIGGANQITGATDTNVSLLLVLDPQMPCTRTLVATCVSIVLVSFEAPVI